MKRQAGLIAAMTLALACASSPALAQTKESAPPTTSSDEPITQPARAGLFSQSFRYVGGDDDGVPEPGERLSVFVTLVNTAQDPATGVSGILKIVSGDASVIDARATWPDIPAGEAKESSTPFVVQISGDAKRSECGGFPVAVDSGGGTSSGSSGSGGAASSDGTVSSDGSVSSTNETTIVQPAGTASAEPGSVEPEPGTAEPAPNTTEPAPDITEPAPPPEPSQDAPVDLSGDITLTSSGETSHTDLFSGAVCLMAGAEKNQTSISHGAPVPARDVAATSAKRKSDAGTVYLIVVLIAAAAALGARYRFNA